MKQTTFLTTYHLRKEYSENSNFDCRESILNDWHFIKRYKNKVQGPAEHTSSLQGSVGLVTQPLNEKAKKFYISCGFKPIAENNNKMIFLFN